MIQLILTGKSSAFQVILNNSKAYFLSYCLEVKLT